MLFTERNTFSCTHVLCIKRSVKYDIPPLATIRRLAKLLVACPSAIREIGQTNRSLRSTQGDTARSCEMAGKAHPCRRRRRCEMTAIHPDPAISRAALEDR